LDFKEQEVLDHVDLEYKKRVYFSKKFLAKSQRKKKRAGLEVDTPETIVIMVSLPSELEIFGGPLIKKLTKILTKNYYDTLWELIEGEQEKTAVIKTDDIKRKIKRADEIKQGIRKDFNDIILNYIRKVIKNGKSESIKKQQAMSYLALKGYDITSINGFDGAPFDDVNIFEKSEAELAHAEEEVFRITDINVTDDFRELEILMVNNTQKDIRGVQVVITHVEEFFEKEVLNESVEEWYAYEELIFVAPVFPYVESYILTIQRKENSEKLFVKLINLKRFI